MTELKILRDLPGIARISELCRNPKNFDYPKSGESAAEIDAVSVSLFGIGHYDTLWPLYGGEDPEEIADQAEYEVQFVNVLKPYEEVRQFWEFIGWDITDGNGEELNCAHFFARQIIALERELVPEARFTPDGSGTFVPSEDEEEREEREDRLESSVQAMVDEWTKRKR